MLDQSWIIYEVVAHSLCRGLRESRLWAKAQYIVNRHCDFARLRNHVAIY